MIQKWSQIEATQFTMILFCMAIKLRRKINFRSDDENKIIFKITTILVEWGNTIKRYFVPKRLYLHEVEFLQFKSISFNQWIIISCFLKKINFFYIGLLFTVLDLRFRLFKDWTATNKATFKLKICWNWYVLVRVGLKYSEA